MDYFVFSLSSGMNLVVPIEFTLGQAIITAVSLTLAAAQALGLLLLKRKRRRPNNVDEYNN